MLNTIAIDDEPIALEIIKEHSVKVSFITLSECFMDAFLALEYLQKNKVDLIFLDIKMPDISGIDFLKSLQNAPLIIFTTAYSQHAVESFELDAIDYLLKPFSFPRFLKACNKAQSQFNLRKNSTLEIGDKSIFIKSGYEKLRIKLKDIKYVEGTGNYAKFVLDNKSVLSRITMQNAIDLLPTANFKRTHRSYIVSLNHITKIEKRILWINEISIPLGSQYIEEIKKITSTI